MKANRIEPPEINLNSICSRGMLVPMGPILAGIIIASITLMPACAGASPPVSTVYSQNSASISSTAVTSTASFSLDTGTGPEFTLNWPPPGGTSLPYLTFYNDRKYTAGHFWVKIEADNTVRIGLTDYGQQAIGEFQTVILPTPGAVLTRDTTFGYVEGNYMEINLTAPVSGTVIQTNGKVLANYDLINQSPYDAGWLVVVRMSNPDDLKLLLTAAEYAINCCPPCHCGN